MSYASSRQNFWAYAPNRFGFKAVLCLSFLFASTANAQSTNDLDRKTLAAHFFLDLSFTAHRSDTMNATDFGTDYSVGLLTWAGKKKNIGMSLTHRQHHVKFTQANSSLHSSWVDAAIYYRYLWFYPFVTAGHCSVEAKRNGTALTDSLCSTFGGGLDLRIPAGAMVIARVGGKATTVSEIRDRLGAAAGIGPLQEYHAGVDITPKLTWMTLNVGFRYRSYQMDTAGEVFKEIETGPYVGCDFHYDF